MRRWVTELRDALLLAETASAAAGGATGEEGGAGTAAQPDVPAEDGRGVGDRGDAGGDRKLAVINGMGDHNRAQVLRLEWVMLHNCHAVRRIASSDADFRLSEVGLLKLIKMQHSALADDCLHDMPPVQEQISGCFCH